MKQPTKLTVKVNQEYFAKEFPDERGLQVMPPDKKERRNTGMAFNDLYLQKCSLQNSSLATEGAIWLGVDNTGPQLDGPDGKKNSQVDARMHLTRKQVEQMLPLLHAFVERGYIDGEYFNEFYKAYPKEKLNEKT